MRSIIRNSRGALLVTLSLAALSACGGGSASAPPVSVAPPVVQQPAEITGVETPSSISVVTATNAN